jgi:hypothetical protein
MSRVLRNIALAAVSLAVSLVASEYAFRALPAAERFGWNAPIDIAARVASLPEKRPGEIRILALSDSFGVFLKNEGRNLFSVVERLGREVGADVRVVNLSVAGTGMRAYLTNLERHGAQVRPDLVLVGLYLGNDISDYEEAVRRGGEPGGGLPEEPTGVAARAAAFVKRHSLLLNAGFRLAKQAVPALRADSFERSLAAAGAVFGLPAAETALRLASVDPAVVDRARADALNPWLLAYGVTNPGYYRDLLDLPAGTPAAAAFELFLRDLDRFAADVRALGAKPVVLPIPVKLQIEPSSHAWYAGLGYATAPAMLGETALSRHLGEALAARGIAAVDPAPALRAAGTVYLDGDHHLNARGNEVAGRALFAGLACSGALGRTATCFAQR